MSTSRPTNPEDKDDQRLPDARHPLTQRTYRSILEQRMAAAQAEGLFDNLPGAGKPQQLDDDSMVPEEDRMGYRILKNAGFAPPWIELQKTIQADRREIDTWLARANGRWARLGAREQARLRDEYRERLTKLNRLILHYNLVVPGAVGQLPTLQLGEELARLGA